MVYRKPLKPEYKPKTTGEDLRLRKAIEAAKEKLVNACRKHPAELLPEDVGDALMELQQAEYARTLWLER